MHAVTRLVKTYTGYTENWTSERLYISYEGEKSHLLFLENGVWRCDESLSANTMSYLRSAAEVSYAIELCRAAGMELEYLSEFLHGDFIPAELLRVLLDELGLGLHNACSIVLRCTQCFETHEFLKSVQPRVFALESVLRSALSNMGAAYHDAYNLLYRSPVGAVENGTELSLSFLGFGGIIDAVCEVYGENISFELGMKKGGNAFSCTFTPAESAALRYRFRLTTVAGVKYLVPDNTGHISRLSDEPDDGFRFTVFKRGFTTPDWFKKRIMYQVFPDRFGFTADGTAQRGIAYHKALGQTPELHGSITEPVRYTARSFETDYSPDDFYGGTLRGITQKLPYLKELGIGVLYLNPIFEARSNHRYDTSSYEKIDPVLGTYEDYANLCKAADELDIKIILDGVFSHTGADSVYFNRFGSYDSVGACQGESSEYYKWYDFRHFPDDYRCWWDFKDLPETDELNPDWQDYIIKRPNSIIKRWLTAGASGWRLDVADELPDEVLSLIRQAAKEVKPDSVIIGEVWEDAVTKVSYGKARSYALGDSLDSVMNYPFRTAVINFALGKTNAFRLRDFLLSQMHNYPEPLYASLMNLLGSHDVERLHTALAFDFDVKTLEREEQASLTLTPEQSERATALQRLCAAIQYCTPGVPCLYYGDEEFMDGARDPFNRLPFEPSNAGLHNFYAELAAIRNRNSCMTDGSAEFTARTPDVLEIIREDEMGKISCIINRSAKIYCHGYDNAVLLLGSDKREVAPLDIGIYKLT